MNQEKLITKKVVPLVNCRDKQKDAITRFRVVTVISTDKRYYQKRDTGWDCPLYDVMKKTGQWLLGRIQVS